MAKLLISYDKLTVQQFWDAGRQYKTGFMLAWLTPLTSLGLGIAVPFFIGKILAALTVPGTDTTQYVYWLIGVCICTVLVNKYFFAAYLAWQPKVMAYLQTQALEALLKRGMSFHNNQISGKLVSDAIDYPSAFSQLSTVFFVDILPFAMIIISGILIVSLSSPLLGLVLFGMTFLVIAATIRFRYRMAPFRYKRQLATKAVTAHLADSIVNTQSIKSFGNEKLELANHKKLSDTLLQSRLHDWGAVADDGNNRIIGLLAFEILFIIVLIRLVQNDPTLLATGIFAFSYTVTLSNRLFGVATMMRTLEESLLIARPMTELLQDTIEITDAPRAKDIMISKGKVELKDVHFHYADDADKTPVFSNMSVIINPGEKIGVVGPSGGGKSTLTKLLLRFEDISSGQILIDEQNIAEVTQESLRKAIAYVPQEPLLFHRSIIENISYGNSNATRKQIEQAAAQAYAYDFITKLPQGFETIVGERGVKLSGGQRQRIAIARAILKDAPLLVLDEATSALDSESEHVIQKALQELMKGRTTIVIAHRLSTIQKMDTIIVLDAGRIIEQGSHQELQLADGMYSKLWSHQSGGFIEE